MARSLAPYAHFRLNLEQQRKRAKELLKAALAHDPAAMQRIAVSSAGPLAALPKLADAQFAIARELRFDSWAALKQHILAMVHERQIVETSHTADALDADRRTLHIRCGSDLKDPLRIAGFRGDFYEHNYPYLIGPVTEGPDCLQLRAQFLVANYSSEARPLAYEPVLESLRSAERQLEDSADYERVVIWSEQDCYDQLVLIRLLAHYATERRPATIELINQSEFPGAVRFIGLGQLPPEALRLLWDTRRVADPQQLQLGLDAWRALVSQDPRDLAAIARTGTPALPLLAPALHRHLRELPSVENGLSFTQAMALGMLNERPRTLGELFQEANTRVDPLPGQGDAQFRDRVLAMEHARARLFVRESGRDRNGESRPPWTDTLTITDLGLAVLRGEFDYLSLEPPVRWVGGSEIGQGNGDWRWDEQTQNAVLN